MRCLRKVVSDSYVRVFHSMISNICVYLPDNINIWTEAILCTLNPKNNNINLIFITQMF